MDFTLPEHLPPLLAEMDAFIEAEIKPLEAEDDNIRFFDHRREDARTDWERDGLPNEEWELLLREARRRADTYLKGGYGSLMGIVLKGGAEAGASFIDKLKMSKSLKNFITIKELLDIAPARTIKLYFFIFIILVLFEHF